MSEKTSFFAELQRRNVYRVAVAYLFAAWALSQGLAQLLPVFDVPNWGVRLVIVLLVLGFPVALGVAWVFELTPEGLKRTEDVDPKKSIRRSTGRKLAAMSIALAALALAVTVIRLPHADVKRPPPSAGLSTIELANIPAKSIAVLPFANLSEDKANTYFADGIQSEILTRLSKIADLKVISHQSTQRYKSTPENLPEIARQLGVAHILEGSVQKAGNSVHVNVQLIRAATDEHLWAESYNRQLDDIFGVEGEVAGAIAAQLSSKLTGAEKQEIAARPTIHAEAYDAYLRGVALCERTGLQNDDLARAVQSFEQAVRLDPNFALAWARLSYAHSLAFYNDDASAPRAESARVALQNALRLQPGLLETQLADSFYHYLIKRDYDRASQLFEGIRQKSPSNSEASRALALIARRQGRWEESHARFDEAVELDPRNLNTLTWASVTYSARRQFPAALKFIDRALDVAPKDAAAILQKALIYDALGQLDEADKLVAQLQGDFAETANAIQLLLRHDYASGLALARASPDARDSAPPERHARALAWMGTFQELSRDADGAKVTYARCLALTEALLLQQPENVSLLSDRAQLHAFLGNKRLALQDADRAIANLPVTKDALEGPRYEEVRARVLASFGDKDEAITILQRLLSIPGWGAFQMPLTPAYLRLDPAWDNLRGDPRFEKLCQAPAK